MATTTAQITATSTAYQAATAGEASASIYTEHEGSVVFAFAASLPAPTVAGVRLPAGWSNFKGIATNNLYVKAVTNAAIVDVVKG